MPRDGEPPSFPASVDHVMAMAHVMPNPHVVVVGHHTLSFVLALIDRGCGGVRSLRPDATAPDCEPADLAWIVDVDDERELDGALRAAHRRSKRIVLEDAACHFCLARLRDRALAAGLDVVSFDHVHRRLLLAPRQTSL